MWNTAERPLNIFFWSAVHSFHNTISPSIFCKEDQHCIPGRTGHKAGVEPRWDASPLHGTQTHALRGMPITARLWTVQEALQNTKHDRAAAGFEPPPLEV